MSLLAFATLGCISVGPDTIPRDRVEYVEALRDSWKRQVLLNVVALRYGEAPSFLEVASVINQYSLEGNADAGFGWGGLGQPTQSLGVGGRWGDRPTITYTPMTGERFVRSMLTPIPPGSVIAMAQAGWPVDFVFGLTVRSVNGVAAPSRSRFMGGARRESAFPDLLAALRRIQDAAAIGMRVDRLEGGDAVILFFGKPETEGEEKDLATVRDDLGLEPGRREFRVTFGSAPADGGEIAMLTRSMIDIMIELSSWVDVPPEDIAAGRTSAAPETAAGVPTAAAPRIRVRWSDQQPDDAFAAVRYRGRWFFVDDRDMESKRSLSFLLVVLSLLESGGGQAAPLVTVGAGG